MHETDLRVDRHAMRMAVGFPHSFNSKEVKFSPPGSRAKASQRPCESLIRDRFKCPRKSGEVGGMEGEGPAHRYAAAQDRMLRSSSNGNWLMKHSRWRS